MGICFHSCEESGSFASLRMTSLDLDDSEPGAIGRRLFLGRDFDGLSFACGLWKLWVAAGDYSGLDCGGNGVDQFVLPAAGFECDPVPGEVAHCEWDADGFVDVSASGSAGRGCFADRLHRGQVR